MNKTLVLCVAAALLGCATAKPAAASRRPDWIDHQGGQWPRELYVAGVGSADERKVAEDRARTALAQIFKTKVTSQLAVHDEESTVRGPGGEQHGEQRTVADDTRSVTEKVLEGVEIAQVWQDPASRTFYALAVLDRHEAAARFQGRLASLEDQAKPLRARLGNADKAAALGGAMKLLRLEQERKSVDDDLRIVAPEQVEAPFQEREARAFLSHVTVALAVHGDSEGVVANAVSAGLARLGLSTSQQAPAADLVADATLTQEPVGEKDGWYWSRAQVDLVLRDPASTRVALHVSETARGAARLQGESAGRGRAKVAEQLRDSVAAAFAKWVEGP